MRILDSSSRSTGRRPDDSARFLEEISELMGLPAESGQEILNGASPFLGPGGLMCRMQVARGSDEVLAVQPQVMLPMPAEELRGRHVFRLLDIQAALVSETGWCLGVSREGMMQVSLTSWIDRPGDAVEALDLGNAVALQTLHLLLEDDDEDLHDAGDPSLQPPHCSQDTSH
jgi:hypothetical protein